MQRYTCNPDASCHEPIDDVCDGRMNDDIWYDFSRYFVNPFLGFLHFVEAMHASYKLFW
jgi:hypothetical protein